MGLFSGSLFLEGLLIRGNFAFQNRRDLDNKNSLKHDDNSLKQPQNKTVNSNSPWAYIGRIFTS